MHTLIKFKYLTKINQLYQIHITLLDVVKEYFYRNYRIKVLTETVATVFSKLK